MSRPIFRASIGSLTLLLLPLAASIAGAQSANEPNFPTDDEIQLVLTQADRAIQQYKPLLSEQERLFGEKNKEAIAKDREVVAALDVAIKAFRQKPQGFNGPLGFSFFEWIDDADRNVLLCASSASNEAVASAIDGKSGKAQSLMRLSQSCMDLSTLLYTVSENAGALYTRYVQGAEKLAAEGAEIATKCAEVMRKSGTARPKQ